MDDSKEIMLALGRLEGKVESILSMQRTHDEEMGRIDKRVRLLEQGKSMMLGGAAVIATIASAIITLFLRSFSDAG